MQGEIFYNEDKCNGLIKILRKLEKNKVVCIDGKWGTGKSYFCEKLIELSYGEFKCIKFNAFEHDHSENPLILLLSEFSKAVNYTEKEKYIKAVSKHAVPLVGKGLDYALSLTAMKGLPGIEGASDKLKDYLEERINNYLFAEESIKGIKKELAKVVEKNESKRVVVIIDELDRCRPSFALEIIEKIKHIFNVDGIHFILSMHKEQVLESISHTYGIAKNSESYLEKFIDFTIYLKPEVVGRDVKTTPQADYAHNITKKSFDEIGEENISDFVANFCSFLVIRNKMEFREIDRFVDKCLTSYVSYFQDFQGGETDGELTAFSVVSNTFFSIYAPIFLNIDFSNRFDHSDSSSRMIGFLLAGGAMHKNTHKSVSDVRKPNELDDYYNASRFYGFAFTFDKNSDRTISDFKPRHFSNSVLQDYTAKDINLCFSYWQNSLKNIS